nr:reverse transcriptase domain-containing protein [Tanacetum cinerariifolium]
MSVMANTTPLLTTVTKPTTNPRETDTTPRVNIQEFCEEYYEDILPIIMDKVHKDQQKDVHTRLDFGEGPRERAREYSYRSSARAKTTIPERARVQDRLRYDNRRVLDRLGYRRPPERQGTVNRMMILFLTPAVMGTTPAIGNEGILNPHHPARQEVIQATGSTGDPFTPRIQNFKSSRRTIMPNNVKTYDETGDLEDYVKVFQATAQVERWAMPTWCHMFNSTLKRAARVWFDELPPESIDSYKDLKAVFLGYFMQQKKYVNDPMEIRNIKQREGETIEDFMERFKVETGRMKGAPECMRISRFMHGINNPELTKRLNEHVPKTMKEMMITTNVFIRGEAAAASKKKGHVFWKAHDRSKRQNSDKRFDFRDHSREGKGSKRFTPLTRTPKEILAPKQGHITDECMQLKKHIEELVRAGKLSHLIKEIKQEREQSKTGKKETAVKDKPVAIYMVQSWQKTVKQKLTQSFKRVKEITFPPLEARNGAEGPLVIEAKMGGHMIHRMYLDGGFSMEILYQHCFNRLRPEIKSQMIPTTTSLTGFSGETIWPLGQLRLLVIIGDATHSTIAWMNFMIVKSLSPYNGIIGRLKLRAIQAVPSTVHGMLKFPVERGIVTIRGTMLIHTKCASVITSPVVPSAERTRPANFKVTLHPDFPDQEVAIGGTLSDKGRTELCFILKKNLDIFAWQPSDMTGASERTKAIQAEVQKLVEAGIMREVYYHDWLSNPVMVKKHDGNWRMCVDFMDLNKACPRDCYPLLEIDWKVESLCGYPIKCFLDAYKGYHQIQLAKPDEEKTAFYTEQGVYCYTKMPFGLKNDGTTYQRLMDKAFEGQIGQNIEVYVDDLVVKSYTKADMIRDIEEPFRTLRKVNIKLNPKKCSFGLAERVFLGYVVTHEGIKPCPDKTAAVLQLPSPRTIKERNGPNNNLLYKPRVTGSGTKLLSDGKTGFVTSLHDKKTSTVFSAAITQEEPWTLFTDGSSCVDGSGAGLILISPEGVEFTYALRFQFTASNNEAEYEALIAGLRIATRMGVRDVHVRVDSKLVVNQVLGTYVAKEDNMVKYLEIVKSLVSGFTTFSISQVPRSKNKKADALSKITGDRGRRTDMDDIVSGLLKKRNHPRRQEGGKKAPPQGQKIRVTGGGPLQTVVPYAMVKMRRTAPGEIHRPITRHPQQLLTPITAPWPFYNIPGEIVSDNGKQFSESPFKNWCDKLNITQRFASVKHPQSNGLVKRANRSLREGIKSRLREGNKNWIEELLHVLWAHRTMIKSSHEDTPFSLTYGTEAVIPTEIGMPTYRTAAVDVVSNDAELHLNLDLLEERRERAAICKAKSKSKMTKCYNARVRGVTFKPDDFVYRSNDASHAVAGGKLGPKWEGPYEVTEALGNGAYKLRSMDGTILPRTWNISNLKRCYL